MSDDAREVRIEPVGLPGYLGVPADARGLVIFAHGSGSGRDSPRNQRVARALRDAGFATLLLDLLYPEEAADRRNVFDIPLLADRLGAAADWAAREPDCAALRLGLFGASTGAAAALVAASRPGNRVEAIVSRGGRPDLAGEALDAVIAPTLLIIGSLDTEVIELNRRAAAQLECAKRIEIVGGATHLFEEPGTLDVVVGLAVDWFLRWLGGERR